jgi:peptide/nickel transport system permease protein
MGRYVAVRVCQAILVIVGISLAAFLLIHLVPGDPARLLAGPRASERAVDALRDELGLNDSLPSQYASFMGGLAKGDLGNSIAQRRPVSEVVGPRILPTLYLILFSLAIAILLAVPLAVLAARRHDRVADEVVRGLSTITFVMPTFWLGLLLALLFSIRFHLLPSSGYGDGLLGHLKSLTLPAIAVGVYVAPVLIRTLRSSLLEALGSDYVSAARARGLSERRVVYRHALRNSTISTVTLLGVFIGGLLSATVVAENVFAIPGLGSLLVGSVSSRDFQTVQAIAVLFGVVVVLVNLATDLLYLLLDARIRL